MAESPASYEFSEQQNQVLETLIARMNLFSWALLVVGPLVAGAGFYADVLLRVTAGSSSGPFVPAFLMTFLVGGVLAMLGLWLRRSMREFRDIVTTKGSDVDHLMQALVQLRLFFQYGGVLAWTLAVIVISMIGFYVRAHELLA